MTSPVRPGARGARRCCSWCRRGTWCLRRWRHLLRALQSGEAALKIHRLDRAEEVLRAARERAEREQKTCEWIAEGRRWKTCRRSSAGF